MGYIDVGLSQSQSIANRASAGAGDFALSGGGAKQSQTLYIVAGIVAVIAFVAWFFRRK